MSETNQLASSGGGSVADGSITTAKIADGTIAGGDLNTSSVMATLTAAALGVPKVVVRTGDATAINSGTTGTTLTNDDTLLWAIAANEVWFFTANILFQTANTAMDLKAAITGPAGASAYFGATGNSSPTINGWGAAGTGATPAVVAISTGLGVGGPNNVVAAVQFAGVVINSSTAGNAVMQFAQNTSDAGNLVIKAYSHLIATRLA